MISLVKLDNVVKIVGGGTPSKKIPEYWGGVIPWASVKDFKNIKLSKTVDRITKLGVENSATNIIPEGNVIVPTRMALGKAAINTVDMAINQDLKALIPTKKLDVNYLLHFMFSVAEYIESCGKGATVKGITLDVLKNLQIPLPSLAEQKRIAAILDKGDELRRQQEKSLELCDEFLKATFIDMFGDPVTNPKGWEVFSAKEVSSKIGSGSTPRGGKEAYKESGISLIRSLNIHDNRFKYKNLAFIDENQAAKLKNVILEEDDVLLNITGASVCRCAKVPKNVLPARVNQHVAIIRTIDSLLPNYLQYLLTSINYKNYLMGIATSGGATREALTKEQVEQLPFIIPPKEEQLKFSRIAENIETQKSNMKESLAKLNENFNALSQKAFKGEL